MGKAVKFPSEAWIKELEVRLNASEGYAQAAANWEGDQPFVILPDDSYPETSYFYINLHHGKATDARRLRSPDGQEALFTTSAPFNTWRKVLEGRLGAISAIMSNKIKLVGSLAQIQRMPKATIELVRVAASIDTSFGPQVPMRRSPGRTSRIEFGRRVFSDMG